MFNRSVEPRTAVEQSLVKIIQKEGVKGFLLALHNVSAHGALVAEDTTVVLDKDDKGLHLWFEGIEKMYEASRVWRRGRR